jgi:hypothetical protein
MNTNRHRFAKLVILAAIVTLARTPADAQPAALLTLDAVRLRASASPTASAVQTLDIATPLVTEGTPAGQWVRVRAGAARGWVRRDLTVPYDAANPLPALRRIATRSIAQESAPFATRARLVNVLGDAARTAPAPAAKAELSLLRLRALQKALDEHQGGFDSNPLRQGRIRADSSEIVYGEPQGQWYVSDDALWALRDRYRALPIAEAIAWEAATQQLPGECEGDATCIFGLAEMQAGRYLSLYPRGTHAPAALRQLTEVLGYVEERSRSSENGPFCRRSGADGAVTPARITALANTVSRSGGADRGRVSTLLRTLAGRCR